MIYDCSPRFRKQLHPTSRSCEDFSGCLYDWVDRLGLLHEAQALPRAAKTQTPLSVDLLMLYEQAFMSARTPLFAAVKCDRMALPLHVSTNRNDQSNAFRHASH